VAIISRGISRKRFLRGTQRTSCDAQRLTEKVRANLGDECLRDIGFCFRERFRREVLLSLGALMLPYRHSISLLAGRDYTTYLRISTSRGLDQQLNSRAHLQSRQATASQSSRRNLAKLLPRTGALRWRIPMDGVRDTAQRLLIERNDTSVLPALETTASAGDKPITALHALWTLDGLRQIKRTWWLSALNSPEPKIRVNALRLSESFITNSPSVIWLRKRSSLQRILLRRFGGKPC